MSQPEQQLPEGWKWESLGAICVPVNQRKPNNQEPPVMSISKYDGFVPSLEYFSKQVFSVDRTKYKYVKAGQFAYSTIHLDEGSIALFSGNEGCLISPMYTTFEVSEKVDGRFLLYLLKSELMIRKYELIAQGSVNRRKSIPFEVFSKILIPLPPLPVQRWIADALGSMDRWIEVSQENVRKILSKSKHLTDLILQKANFDSEPYKLSEVGVLQTGLQIGKKYKEPIHEYPYLRVANVKDGFIDTSTIKTVRVSENEAKRRMLQRGDVLLTEGGDADKLGRGAVWDDTIQHCLHQNHVFCFRPDTRLLLPEYLALTLRGSEAKTYFRASSKQTTNLASINSTQLKAFVLRIPSIEKQKSVIEEMANLDIWLRSETESISHIQKIKTHLLNQLLSGQLQPVEGWEAVT